MTTETSDSVRDSVRPLTAAEEEAIRLEHDDRNPDCLTCRTIAALDEARAGSLDAAWQEAEAALPEGWTLTEVMRTTRGWQARAEPTPAYKQVRAHTPSIANGGWGTMWLGEGVNGDTPVAAIRALAAALREAQPSDAAQCGGCEHPPHIGRCNMPTGHLGVVSCYCRRKP